MNGQPVRCKFDLAEPIGRIVVSRDRIARRVRHLGRRIAECYASSEELTILAVLTGSLVFLADLIRQLPLNMRVDLVSVSSYSGEATRSRGPRFDAPIPGDLAGKDVLIVDDILDSGRTLTALTDAVAAAGPASLRICVLLAKRRADLSDRPRADFVGFEIDDEFVVGYGLDFDHRFRNLPDVCVLKRRVSGGGAS